MTRRTTRSHTRSFYDRISGSYDLIADASEHAIRDRGIRALGLSEGQRVLEIGYGTGHGLVSLAEAVGKTGRVHGVDLSSGMTAIARARLGAAGLRNVTLAVGDARDLCIRSNAFDAVFMSFTLELFESAVPQVLAEVRRVLRDGGRLGVVAMAETGETNPMIDLYQWAHRHWPRVVDCRPIDVLRVLRSARFQAETADAGAIWTLPVVIAIGVKTSVRSHEGRRSRSGRPAQAGP
jgi:demethylmenaquinone methyltransferase/2-methoxy-6-polyprenyl-1,4-benzoquinol methylase